MKRLIAAFTMMLMMNVWPYFGTMPVASKTPNAFGLYDMVGNVWEFCNDVYSSQYDTTDKTDPFTARVGNDQYQNQLKTARGGSWMDNVFMLRSSNRQSGSDKYIQYGFRCALNQAASVSPPAGMKLVPAGTFQRGSRHASDERPVATIQISAFYLDSTEVTQAAYQAVMDTNPSYFSGQNRPVECVTWANAIIYCNKKSVDEGRETVYVYRDIARTDSVTVDLSKNGYRLPTEAEWEYACRAGSATDFFWNKDLYPYPQTGLDTAEIGQYAVWRGNAHDWGGPKSILSAGVPDIPEPDPSVAVVRCSTAAQLIGMFYRGLAYAVGHPVTIYLKDGEYDLSYWIWGNDGNGTEIHIDLSRTSIIGESKDPTKVIIRGRKFAFGGWGEEALRIRECDSVTLAYFTLADVGGNGVKFDNFGSDTVPMRNILIHNVIFEDICERSIKGPINVIPTGVTIQYCLFEQLTPIIHGLHRTTEWHSDGNYIAGMDVMNATGWNVHRNLFKNIRGADGIGRGGIFFWVKGQNDTIENNMFYGCDRSIALGNPSGDSLHVSHAIVRNNVIVQGAWYSMELCRNTGNKIYNNTIFSYRPDSALWNRAAFHMWQNYDQNEIKNNVIFGGLWLETGTMPDTQNNVVVINNGQPYPVPWFVDTAAFDFHLTTAAVPLINNGIVLPEVSADFDGLPRDSLPDIGADEFSNGTWTEDVSCASGEPVFQVWPNPFNPVVTISTGIRNSNWRYLRIYNLAGQLIADLTPGISKSRISWDASGMPSGIYIVRAQVAQKITARAIMLMK